MRISLLAGELQAMRLSSSGALLSGAASSRLFQLITSVLTLLFTTSSIVSCQSALKLPQEHVSLGTITKLSVQSLQWLLQRTEYTIVSCHHSSPS